MKRAPFAKPSFNRRLFSGTFAPWLSQRCVPPPTASPAFQIVGHLTTRSKRMVAQTSRALTPLAALMCDLDHFKEINDRFGHGRGDDVLAAVGAALSHSLRAGDFAGRYGGEEFLILLPATGIEGAMEAADRVRASVADIRVPSVDRRISLSVGIAVLPDHAIDAQSLERASDRALYAAKKAGRDRAEIFNATSDAVEPRVATIMTNGAPELDASLLI